MPLPAALMFLLPGIFGAIRNASEEMPLFASPEEVKDIRRQRTEQRQDALKAQDELRKKELDFAYGIMKSKPEEIDPEHINMAVDILKNQGLQVPEALSSLWMKSYDAAQFRKAEDAYMTGGAPPSSPTSTTTPPPKTSMESVLSPKKASLAKVSYTTPDEIPYYGKIQTTAQKHGIKNVPLFISMVHSESGFDPLATSPMGARGLSQVMPGTAAGLGVTNPKALYDVDVNLDTGARYFKQMEDRFGGNPQLIAAAYNAGPEAVDKHGGVPPYRETQDYVNKVSSLEPQYAKVLGMPSAVAGLSQPPGARFQPAYQPPRGVSITRKGRERSVTIDYSKMTPSEDERFSAWLGEQDPAYLDAYNRAKANVNIYGKEPLQFETVYNYDTGEKGLNIYRKQDGSFLGTQWSGIQERATPQQQVEQAGKEAAARTAASEVAKVQGSQQLVTTPSGEQKPVWEIEAEQKAATQAKVSAAEVSGKRSQEMIPVETALGLIEDYSRRVHTQNTELGALLNGAWQTVKSWSPTGTDAKSYKDYSQAFTGNLARVFSAERGVLTQQDVTRAQSLIVGLFATKQFSEQRFRELHDFIDELKGRPVAKKGEYKEGHVYPSADGKTYGVYRGINKETGNHRFETIDIPVVQ
jgi:hypothetical protein